MAASDPRANGNEAGNGRRVPPMEPGPEEIRAAAGLLLDTLRPLADRDWSIRAGDLEWDARHTLEHVADVLARYANHLASRAVERLPHGRTTDPDWSVADLLATTGARAAVLAEVVAAAPLEVRGYHVLGMADRSGFAAMACDELLIHTDDIARGFGAGFAPDPGLCRRVLARLFPWAPPDADPWPTLRWANGRAPLPDRPRQGTEWAWHCAPLADWDGTVPVYRP